MAVKWLVHVDLHETTDSDFVEFRPARAARDGKVEFENNEIPDGFYTIGNEKNPIPEFYKTVIDSVRKQTHIALPDDNNQLIGLPVQQDGVVHANIPGVCMFLTDAPYSTTTEMYPDSKGVTDDECNRAQLAVIVSALDFVMEKK